MIKVRDLIAAEERLEEAEREYRKLQDDPAEWSAYESMDARGRKVLNISPGHFERQEAARGRIELARQQVLDTRRAFLEGVFDAKA